MPEKFQLHVTALSMLSKCGEQFRRRYPGGEKLPPGVAALVGTAVHRTKARDLVHKIETGALLSAEEIRDLARDNLTGAWDQQGVLLTPDEAAMGITRAKGEAIDKTIRLEELHHRQVAPALSPTHIEQPFVLDISGYDFQLAGTIDIREVGRIRDTKTSHKSPSDGEAGRSLQLTAYALAVQVETGVYPRRGFLDYLVDTKVPKAVSSEREFAATDFNPFLERVAQAHRAIEAGVFVPARPEDWWCSEKWCGYFPTCKYALRPAPVSLVNIAPVSIAQASQAGKEAA